MKRSEALKLIANQLDFLNGKFEGARDDFSKDELSKADVILTTLEEGGMKPPRRWIETPYGLTSGIMLNEWEDED